MESNGEHPAQEFKRQMVEMLRKQEQAHFDLMAFMIALHGEIRAVVASSDAIVDRQRSGDKGSYSIAEEFWRIRKEKIQESLIELENQNPEVAARVQQILDGP